jgi:hypothetical protein
MDPLNPVKAEPLCLCSYHVLGNLGCEITKLRDDLEAHKAAGLIVEQQRDQLCAEIERLKPLCEVYRQGEASHKGQVERLNADLARVNLLRAEDVAARNLNVDRANRFRDERDAALLQVRVLRDAVEFVASKRDLTFAECSDAEEIVMRCREALEIVAQKPKCAECAGPQGTIKCAGVHGCYCGCHTDRRQYREGDGHICITAEDVPCSLCGRVAEKRKCDKQYAMGQDYYGFCGREQGHDGDHGRND